ncbi:MAG: anthranilate synthase component I family protein [Cytophagaceae bacterium]
MQERIFQVDKTSFFFQKALQRAFLEDYAMLLNGNTMSFPHGAFPKTIAFGSGKHLSVNSGNAFEALSKFHKNTILPIFGYIAYDLKNELENLKSNNPDYVHFPDMFFFHPDTVIHFEEEGLRIISEHPETIFREIQIMEMNTEQGTELNELKSRISKEKYLETVERIKQHIVEGDVYELNFCMEFFTESAKINPLDVYEKLNKLSPMPFSSLLKNKSNILISASPERFLKKTGKHLITQPIKGTVRRGNTKAEDEDLKEYLRNNEKEQAENMMIVDLCRNDLAKSSIPGSVVVEELFGIYSFSHVHQMISTVTSAIKPDLPWIEALKNAFPMGSMTGAPKIRAMELIEEFEQSKRGLFSGATGYITANGDFDFNVVIRSILYNEENNYLSFQAGSAITYDADPEREYEEVLLKTKAIREALFN